MNNLIFFIISFCIFTSYILFIWFKYGIQKSISESYYRLPYPYGFIFTLVLWGFSIPLFFVTEFPLMFFAVSGICFTGAAPMFKSLELEKKVHYVGAIFGIIFGILTLVLNLKYYFVLSLLLIFPLIYKLSKNYFWWIEIISFYIILFSLFYFNLNL